LIDTRKKNKTNKNNCPHSSLTWEFLAHVRDLDFAVFVVRVEASHRFDAQTKKFGVRFLMRAFAIRLVLLEMSVAKPMLPSSSATKSCDKLLAALAHGAFLGMVGEFVEHGKDGVIAKMVTVDERVKKFLVRGLVV
jgi:hypothetical protein